MFKSQYDPHERVICSSGSDTTLVPQFALSVDENGCQCLKHVGTHNLYQEIQNYREGCDMSSIINNLDPAQTAGLMSSFDVGDLRNVGVFDVTKIPKNYGDFLNRMKEATHIFNGLPNEVRQTFNYSTDFFLKSLSDGSIDEKLSPYVSKYIDSPLLDNDVNVQIARNTRKRGRPPKNKEKDKNKEGE